jgi:hypothetical protein
MPTAAAARGTAAACLAVTAPRLFPHHASTFRACPEGRPHHN